MITFNLRTYAFAILGLAFGVYIIVFLFSQDLESLDFEIAISDIFKTISINAFLWFLFVKWGWKWKIFYPWLVPFPDLEGEWEGYLNSNYQDKKEDKIDTAIKIHQTFFNIQIRIKTGESRSYSTAASFDIDKDRGLQQLFYSYLNTPKSSVRKVSEIHYGTTLLNFEGFKIKEMEGHYWTDRESTGEIYLKRKTLPKNL